MTADAAKVAVVAIKADNTVTVLHYARAKELMTIALGVGISLDDSTTLIAAQLAKWDRESRLSEVTRQFFSYLDRTEESDSGNAFHPVSFGCCRSAWVEPMEKLMAEMKSLSGSPSVS